MAESERHDVVEVGPFQPSGKKRNERDIRRRIGRAGGIRTHDLFVPNEARYQLRYSSITGKCFEKKMVEPAGFELATPWSQTKCATSCATARHFLRVVSLNPTPHQGKLFQFDSVEAMMFAPPLTTERCVNQRRFSGLPILLGSTEQLTEGRKG